MMIDGKLTDLQINLNAHTRQNSSVSFHDISAAEKSSMNKDSSFQLKTIQ